MTEKEMAESFWLCSIDGIGAKSVEKLLEKAGSLEGVSALPDETVLSCLGSKRAESFRRANTQAGHQRAQRRLEGIREKKITFLPRWHPDFPARLRQIPDPPLMLFAKGALPKEEQKQAALIGARACSAYGAQVARFFAENLAVAGVGILSGMARGIDSIAQETALFCGQHSTAVLGCGVDICYPPENRRLYERLEREGCLLSEYLPGTRPQAHLFPPRNRIISGLADLVLVVEARVKSGTLITVDMALEQGREVFAVPGRVMDVCSQGCNQLIGNGAGIATDPAVLLEALGRCAPVPAPRSQDGNWVSGPPTRTQGSGELSRRSTASSSPSAVHSSRPLTRPVFEALGSDCLSLDEIAARTGGAGTISELMQELTLLYMEGTVTNQGGRYCRKM